MTTFVPFLLTVSLFLGTDSTPAPQSPVAQFMFEDAEALFAEKKYDAALKKLDEAEKEFGKINPPILFLRIMTRHEKLKAAAALDFQDLERLRADCSEYLNTFGTMEVLRDNAREVYRVAEDIKKHPATRVAYAEALHAAGKHAAALKELTAEEKATGKLPGPALHLRILATTQVVEHEDYGNAIRARALARDVEAYLASVGDTAKKPEDVLRIKATLVGLEDVLKGRDAIWVSKDYAKARTHMLSAAEQGSPLGMEGMGFLERKGLGGPANPAAAREWYEKAAAAGNRVGMRLLGVMYETGEGVPRDYVLAREWYEKAAVKGDAYSMNGIGDLFRSGLGVTKSPETALEWYRKGAAAGSPYGQRRVGHAYREAAGVPEDLPLARQWYEKAANGDDAAAMYWLGTMLQQGKGGPVDASRARVLFEKAYAGGNVDSAGYLGWMYREGSGVTQNFVTAREWYEKGAAKGAAYSMRGLETLYGDEKYGMYNRKLAKEWRKKAEAVEEKAQN